MRDDWLVVSMVDYSSGGLKQKPSTRYVGQEMVVGYDLSFSSTFGNVWRI
jgi:hypothetical protein